MEKNLVTITAENIDEEHICCAIGNDARSRRRALEKKEWLKKQIPEGFVFKKLDARGKVFIEYVPAEKAWKPIDAPGYNLINCFWVSGKFKGQGYGRMLLEEAINDSRDANGLVVVTGNKNMPWLVDKKMFLKFGFQPCDEAPPYFELLVRRNNKNAPDPVFRESARKGSIDDKEGVVIMYSHQCPFHEDFVEIMLETAREVGLKTKKILIDNLEDARNVPYAQGLVGIYLDGEFIGHEITTAKKFEQILREKKL
jgi:GNAT superfamily N-acetyltransferase